MGWDPALANRGGWTDGALTSPWEGFELCYECDGTQLCDHCGGNGGRCPTCFGAKWCAVCGGAGQWPIDPDTRYFAPRAPQINLRYLAEQRKKGRM